MRNALVAIALLLIVGLALPAHADSAFNPTVSVDVGLGGTINHKDEPSGGGGFAGVAFSAFGNRLRGGGIGVGVLFNDISSPVLYAPVHAIMLGSGDCGLGYGDECRGGGLAFHVAPYWDPSRNDIGFVLGFSLIGGR